MLGSDCKIRIAAALVCLMTSVWPARAADAESREFESAEKLFRDGYYENAEKRFADFIIKHPAAPRLSQALLLQSQSALAQKKFRTAIDVLATNMTRAAGIADQFQFQIAKAQSESG